MLYDVGLIATVAIAGWLALDVAMAETWRRRSSSLGWMGFLGALWAASELLLRVADEPAEFAGLRRLLYFAVAGSSFAWYWVALEADAPRWFRQRPGIAVLPLAPAAIGWSSLWWAPDGSVISLYGREPSHGPYWMLWAVSAWSLIGLGLVHYGRAALRLRQRDLRRAQILGVGICLPLVFNVAYAAGWIGIDPAPCLLGLAALAIRFAVVDLGLSRYLPLAHKDIVEQLEVGVLVADRDDHVLDANASAARLLGRGDLRGACLDDLARDLDPGIELLRFPLQSHATRTGTAAVLTDRRQAFEAEQRLQLAGRLEAIGSLTAGIAHEVNNPLAYICTNLNTVEKLVSELQRPSVQQRLGDDLRQLSHEGAESLSDAQEGIERISLLVARLKGFARRPGTIAPEVRVDVAGAARKAASVAGIGLAEGAIRMRGEDPCLVPASEEAVVQILVNLMLNAVQASGPDPEIDVEVRRTGGEVEVRVCDRGRGIEEPVLDRIFDPFFTTKPSGSGLGLSISFDLARRLGGRLAAENRKGGGAVFSLLLPDAGS